MEKAITKERFKQAVKEYVFLGLYTGLFNQNNAETILSRINKLDFVLDNTLPGDAKSDIKSNIIRINANKCLSEDKPEYYLDEILFHEFSHFLDDISRDLYVYGSSRIMSFKNNYKEYAEGNDLVRYPEWGMLLLDEIIAQYTAQLMVEAKYKKSIYPRRELLISDLCEPKLVISSDVTDYSRDYYFAKKFASTVFSGEDALFKVCQTSYDELFIENMFVKYQSRDNGMKELYEILGFMGNILLADYADRFHFTFNGTEINRDKKMIYKSMVEVRDRAERLKEN